MKKQLLFALLFTVSMTAFGQNSPEDIINQFFKEYSQNTSKAIDDIYSTNPWTIRIKDAIENLKKEVNGYTVDYVGKFYGYEPITVKQLSQSFVLYSYMARYDRQPIRFTFQFYKPNDKWTLFSFKIDSNLDDEIEQAAKIYYLNLDKK